MKKLGNILDGGGWGYVGRGQGKGEQGRNPRQTPQQVVLHEMRHAFVHTVIDDHTRIAYAEVHDDETSQTAAGVLARAVAWYQSRGISVERVLSDNGAAYKSHLWHTLCDEIGITVKKTRPYRPQTNGKIERFHRTRADGCAYARHYQSETERRAALAG